MKKLIFLIAVCLAAVCNSCSDDKPEVDTTDECIIAEIGNTGLQFRGTVSASDFNRLIAGKIWTAIRNPHIYVSGDGNEWETVPYAGGGIEYGLIFDPTGKLTILGSHGIGSGSDFNSGFYTSTNNYIYDEATGIIYCDDRLNPFGVMEHSMYVESLTEDVLIMRTDYGLLPIGYTDDPNVEVSDEKDRASYCRKIYTVVPDENVQKCLDWFGLSNE